MKGKVINETIHRNSKNYNSNNIHCTLQNTKHLKSYLERQRREKKEEERRQRRRESGRLGINKGRRDEGRKERN